MKPSRKAVYKARLAAAYRQHREGRDYFRPILITGHRVQFRYGGHLVEFVFEAGRVLRVGTDSYPYLQPEDYALLHSEAKVLMQAALNGYERPEASKATVCDDTPQLQFNFLQNPQSRLRVFFLYKVFYYGLILAMLYLGGSYRPGDSR